jgi:hypothetical protein
MPGIHAVMKAWHPMIGRDLHTVWPPGSPTPGPPAPFVSSHVLLGFGAICSVATTHNSMGWGWTMQKGTDIGFLIPHFGPPSLLTPLDMIFSASKSYFGSSRNMVEGKPICCALFGLTNFNLNCGSPMPFSVGFVAALNTHMVSMSIGDILHGLLSFGIDFALQCALSWLIGKGADKITNRIAPAILSKRAAKQLLRGTVKGNAINNAARALVARQTAQSARFLPFLPVWLRHVAAVNPVVNTAVGTAVGFLVGGPMGLDAGAFGAPTPGGAGTTVAQDQLNNTGVQDLGSGSGSGGSGTGSPGGSGGTGGAGPGGGGGTNGAGPTIGPAP